MTDYKDVTELLGYIQKHIKAPKTRQNKFGNYMYRNCEDILDAIKPHMPDGAACVVTDNIELIGQRFYVKATACLKYKGAVETATAFARECDSKKGMDDAQLTAATSSYARKTALNGLLMIDDAKDADEQEAAKEAKKEAKKEQYNFVNQINACKSKEQLITWFEVNEPNIENLPLDYCGVVKDQYEARVAQFDKGIAMQHKYDFVDTKEMNAWMLEQKPRIEACDSVSELAEWEEVNKPKLAALDAKRKTSMRELIQARLAAITAAQSNTMSGG